MECGIVLHCTRERNLIHVVIVGNIELFTDFITNIHIPHNAAGLSK